MKKIICLLLCVLMTALCLAGCGKTAPAAPDGPAYSESGEFVLSGDGFAPAAASDGDCRVFYEIFVGSFSDSDGDGVGDLRGIIDRMDYLNDGDPDSGLSLGVEGLWLTPIFESPSYHKYDISDFYKVDPAFGTAEDLKELADLCHARGVKLILDLPINHTSSGNLWFIQFRASHKSGDTANPYYDFYTWCTEAEKPSDRAFNRIPETTEYYECNFWDQMPELNFDNPAVREAVVDVARTWLELGVDGFRFDAAKYVYYGDHARNLEFWIWYMDELRAIKPDLYTVAEVWDPDGITDLYYPALNCFNFTVSQVSGLIASAAKGGDAGRYTAYVESYLDRVKSLRADATIVPFVANHDTDRAAGFLPLSDGSMRMAANLYLLGPGSPFIYYGEEIGMKGTRGNANTDSNRRLAMLWGDGDTVKDPVGSTYDASKQPNGTVADQIGDPSSLFTYYKTLLMIRRANPEIASGDYRALSFEGSKLGGFTSTLAGSTVCVLHNTTAEPITVDLVDAGLDFSELRAAVGPGGATLEGTTLTIGAQTSVVLR
ncbi:MAG: hypothetical protein IJJ43_01900 [Oscillospiraceae bacterium]|nr:hypothetical protein [Oscillospiraceae bacterium]